MNFYNPNARLYIPDSKDINKAFENTTDLCICAHQDDCEIMAFAPIFSCYEKEDKWFSCITLTDGAGSPRTGKYANYTNEQMKQVRLIEQETAASIGKYSFLVQLGYTSAVLKDISVAEPENELVALIEKAKPERIFVHNPADKHPTHVAACVRAINAIKKAKLSYTPKVYAMEVWRALDWLSVEDKVLFDCSGGLELAKELIGAFDSQVAGGKNYYEAAKGRWLANATFFESHDTDNFSAVSYGIDITEVIEKDISLSEFILNAYNKTKIEIENCLKGLKQ